MNDIQKVLKKYKTIQDFKNQYENIIESYLRLLLNNKPKIIWDSVVIDGKRFHFDTEIHYYCGDTDYNSYVIPLSFFEDPEKYIKDQQELAKIAKQEEIDRENLRIKEQELELLKTLKKKYGE